MSPFQDTSCKSFCHSSLALRRPSRGLDSLLDLRQLRSYLTRVRLGARILFIEGKGQAEEAQSLFHLVVALNVTTLKDILEEDLVVKLAPNAKPNDSDAAVDHPTHAPEPRAELRSLRLPNRSEAHQSCGGFTSIDGAQRPFFPEIKAHTNLGLPLRALSQTQIHFASRDYRLRSDHLAQTLRLFGHKVSQCLPEGFCVQVDLSPFGGNAACDTVTLIHQAAKGGPQAILEHHYLPFNGGGIGWMVPTDEAKNTVLKLEERLFYYKALLAIRTAIHNRLSYLSTPA